MREGSEMTGTIHVGIYDGWADWEAGHVLGHLGSGDWQPDGRWYDVLLVSDGVGHVTTKGGLTLSPDLSIAEVDPAASALLVLPGSATWLTGGNRPFAELGQQFLEQGRAVAAICGATVGLASVGALNERRHTSNAPQILEVDGYAGHELYAHELAVTDRGLVTASGIAPVEFARAVFAQLEFYPASILDSWYQLYGQHDPAGFFGLMAGSGVA